LVDIAADRAIAAEFDPALFVRSAAAHGMSGLVWSRVLAGDVTLPREHAVALAVADVATRDRHAQLLRTIVDVTTLLEARGVPVAVFKGLVAEQRWYQRPGERPFADVDLLLAPPAVGRLGEVVDLLDASYPRRAGLDRRVELGLQHAATVGFGGVTIDLHVEVPKFGMPSRSRSELWACTETHRFDDGSTIRALDADGHLVAFLTTIIKDRFARLLAYSDVRRIASDPGIDWERVAHIAAIDSLDRPINRALHAVMATLDLPVPGPWRPPRPSLSWSVLCRPGARLAGTGPRPRRLLLMPLVVPGRRIDVTRSLARRVRPPREVAGDLYPDGAGPVARWRKDHVATSGMAPEPTTTSRPTISVVLPTYQRRGVVLDAVRSVLDQDVPPDEVIVVDDGSTDGTADALEAAFGASVRVVRQANRGPSAARNEGIRQARSDVIAFQDSDNRWLPHHLALIHDLLARHPDAALVATTDDYQFGDGTAPDARRRDVAEALLLDQVDIAFLTTTACPRPLLEEIGSFDEQLRFGEDIDLFIRLALHGPLVTVAATTVQRGTQTDSLQATGRAEGLYVEFMTRSAANALAEMSRPSAIVTDAALHAAMARRAIAAILSQLEAGTSAAELRPFIDDALRWQPGFAASPQWIVRQVDAANRDRGNGALHREMLTTIAETFSSVGAGS